MFARTAHFNLNGYNRTIYVGVVLSGLSKSPLHEVLYSIGPSTDDQELISEESGPEPSCFGETVIHHVKGGKAGGGVLTQVL